MNNIIKISTSAVFAFVLLALAFKPTFASTNSYGHGQMDGVYSAKLSQANHSGVSGSATFTLSGNRLTVEINAYGLESKKAHPQHIHGFANDRKSRCATPSDDKNKNGWIEMWEAQAVGGQPMVDIAPYPVAYKGSEHFSKTFYVNSRDLSPLSNRVIELHGMSVHGKYDATMPVACGAISFQHKINNGNHYDNQYSSYKPDGHKSYTDNKGSDCKNVAYGSKVESKNTKNNYQDSHKNNVQYTRNNANGHDSHGQGSSTVNLRASNTTRISQSNTANVSNSVNIHANTGGNNASYNTRGNVSVSSGNTSTSVGIHNNVNSNYLSL